MTMVRSIMVHQRQLHLSQKVALLVLVRDRLADEVGVWHLSPYAVDFDEQLALVGARCAVRPIACGAIG